VKRLLVSLALVLSAAAPAAADTLKIGSDLSADPSIAVANPQDWSAWSTALPGGGQVTAPVDGELNAVSIKGIALQAYKQAPNVFVGVQVLHPQGDGQVQATVTSENLHVPASGDPNQVNRYGRDALELPTSRMCVKKGDYIAFFVNGGAEVRSEGVQLQVFARSPGAATDVFKTPAGGSPPGQARPFSGRTSSDVELLMQAEIGTGADARPFCGGTEGSGGGGGGGGGQSKPAPLTIVPQAPTVAGRALKFKLKCNRATACAGKLTFVREGKTLLSQSVSVAANSTRAVSLTLTKAGGRVLHTKKAINVAVKVTSGGRADTRTVRLVLKR
jgi:hypothetical protein